MWRDVRSAELFGGAPKLISMDAGQRVGGYRLIERRGIGGAGTVWLAMDDGGTPVALKLLHPALAADQVARDRLAREARTVNAVKSAGVAHVLDVEVDDVQPFIVSEFVDGPTLAEVLAGGPLSQGEALRCASQLFETVQAVHDAGVIHRDIKPGNVIMSSDGSVLIDFGIAQGEDDLTLTAHGFVSGTASYASPDILRGSRPNEGADWWAWVATILHALTGRPPFGSGSTEAVMNRVLSGTPDVAGLPWGVAQVFRRALHPDAQQRLSAADLLDALSVPDTWALSEAPQDAQATTILSSASAPREPLAPSYSPANPALDASAGHTKFLPVASEGGTSAFPAGVFPGGAYDAQAAPAYAVPAQAFPSNALPLEGPEPLPAAFSFSAPPSTPFVVLSLLAALGLLPIFMGGAGVVWMLTALLIVGIIGGISRSVRQRRLAAMGIRRSDWWVALVRSPLTVLRVILTQALGLSASAAIVGVLGFLTVSIAPAWVGEAIYVSADQVPHTLFYSEASPAVVEVTTNVWVALGLYGFIVLGLLLMWAFPSGRDITEGIALPVRTLLPPAWARGLLVMMILGAIGVTWWLPVKSLVFWF